MKGTVVGIVAHMGVFALLIVVARQILNRWASTDTDNDSAVLDENMAVALRHGAFYLALGLGLYATLSLPGSATSVWGTVLESLGWGVGIMLGMFVALFINDRLILPSVNNSRAVGQNNVAVGVVEAASLLGSALIIGGTMQGTGPVMQTAVFFVIGQLAMIATVWIYDWIATDTNYQTEIGVSGNLSAGIVFAGKIVAIALIIRNAVSGDTQGWMVDLTSTFVSFLVGAVALYAVEYIVDAALLPNVRVGELVRAKRAAPMVLLAALSIATALFVTAVSPF